MNVSDHPAEVQSRRMENKYDEREIERERAGREIEEEIEFSTQSYHGC
jgi:hypothetical protein